MGALTGKLTKTSIDKQFQDQGRDMAQPGTSCLFLSWRRRPRTKVVKAMSKYRGTVLKPSLTKQDQQELQDAPGLVIYLFDAPAVLR